MRWKTTWARTERISPPTPRRDTTGATGRAFTACSRAWRTTWTRSLPPRQAGRAANGGRAMRKYLWRGYQGYELEHVQADRFDRDGRAFGRGHPADFQAQRNRIGGLLLVPGWVNGRVRDMEYTEKRSAAVYPNVERWKNRDAEDGGRNLLVLSLIRTREECERDEPGFCRFADRSGLPFFRENIGEFTSADVDARQALYAGLARRIWDVGEVRRALQP